MDPLFSSVQFAELHPLVVLHCQWATGRSFREILSLVPIGEILGRYHPLHEEPESHFVDWVESMAADVAPVSSLREARHLRGWSQEKLAERAGVTLRSIRNYEQHPETFARAEHETAVRLGRSLQMSGAAIA